MSATLLHHRPHTPAGGAGASAHPGRRILRVVADLVITLGVLALLLGVYQLWWTNIVSGHDIATGRQAIEQQWANVETAGPATPAPGDGIALLYIPRLRDRVWGLPIIEGSDSSALARGAGHYIGTAMPGEVGNFAIAAHRSTHAEPFADFDDLRAGDQVFVRTKDAWYTYTLTHDDPNLAPHDSDAIAPDPDNPEAAPTKQLITLTTCTPRYGSTGRWAWWGELTATSATSAGPPAEIADA